MFESKNARQQYLPAEVIVAAGESTVLAAWLTGTVGVSSVPTLPAVPSHVPVSTLGGPHSQNLTVPLHVVMPVTVTAASSLTVIDPAVVIDSPPVGMPAPVPSFGVVRRLEPQSWKLFSAKSLSVASSDVPVPGPDDDRVSARKLGKQVPAPVMEPRSMKPSMNADAS